MFSIQHPGTCLSLCRATPPHSRLATSSLPDLPASLRSLFAGREDGVTADGGEVNKASKSAIARFSADISQRFGGCRDEVTVVCVDPDTAGV